jgi:hypothetical protein
LYDTLNLRFGFGQRDRQRQAPIRREPIAFIRGRVFLAIQQTMRRQHGHQRLDHFALTLRQHFWRKLGGCVHVSSRRFVLWSISKKQIVDLAPARLCRRLG